MKFTNVIIAFLILYKLVIPYPPIPESYDVSAKINNLPFDSLETQNFEKYWENGILKEVKIYNSESRLQLKYSFNYDAGIIIVTEFERDGVTIKSTTSSYI